MHTFFLALSILGAAVLLLQIVLSMAGLAHDLPDHTDLAEGLGLLSVRALAAGVAAYGLAGLAALGAGLPDALAAGAALLPGIVGAYGTAWATRQMLRLEGSGTLRMADAVGQGGTVHVSIPAVAGGAGRVQFALQGRTVEMKAVSAGEAIPSGTPVTIVGLLDDDTVEVLPTPTMKEILG